MTKQIKKIAIIGAGAMGSGIAAQAANAGCEVVLLDIREGAAEAAVERMKKAHPAVDPFNAGFMDANNARLITCGTTDKDIEKIGDADLVIEAVFERLDVKQNTFRMIEKYARPDALITSNTSTLTIDHLVEGMSDSFKNRFMNAHFFNPPRFMRLLELIAGPETAPETFEAMRDYGDRHLGKKVVQCKDMPGFIANRIGVFIIERARAAGVEQGMKVEDIDAILGTPFGFPKLGVFKLADAVGVDIVQHVGKNLNAGLPGEDMFNRIYDPSMVNKMVADGYTGKKGKGGFYRSGRKTGTFEAIDLKTGEYRAAGKSKYDRMNIEKKFGSLQTFFESDTVEAKFAWPVLRDTLNYVLTHAEEIAYDVQSIDEAMQAGYNWKHGPFELLDKIGVEWFTAKLEADGINVPPLLAKAANRPFYHVENNVRQVMDFNGTYEAVKAESGVIRLGDFKRAGKPLISHNSAKLWDIGDGVVCVEFTSKQNSMDGSILHVLNESIKLVDNSAGKYKAMVIYNDGENFSVGANLKIVDLFNKVAAAPAKFGPIGRSLSRYLNGKVEAFVENQVFQGQAVYKALREAPFPVIGAPKGQALGGGCEILLHCDGIQAGAESYIGLVEVGVGLLPAWGGCARYLERAQNAPDDFKGPMIAFKKAAMAIAAPMESLSSSAQDAIRKLWLRPGDGISMNSDRLLADAKAKALAMVPGYKPPAPATFNLPGAAGKAAIRMNVDSMYFRGGDVNKGGINQVDVATIDRLAHVLSGGETVAANDAPAHLVNGEALQKTIAERLDGRVGVTPALTLTEGRILQLEREAFLALFRTEAAKKRIDYTMTKGRPLREQRADPTPAPRDIRAGLSQDTALTARVPDGKPLTGADGRRLHNSARTTALFYKIGGLIGLG